MQLSTSSMIREYRHTDKEAVMNVMRLNTPLYFAPEEEADLSHYLDHEREYYYVIESGGIVVGSGGINFPEGPAAGRISWDLLHPDHQGRGLGKELLHYRIDKLRSMPGLEKIIVRTTQLAYGFYEKSGFVLLEVVKDHWAPGFDMYVMELSTSAHSY